MPTSLLLPFSWLRRVQSQGVKQPDVLRVWIVAVLYTAYSHIGTIRLAERLGPGHTIVTILCDSGARYQSKMWNPAFLREKGLPAPDWL